MKMNIQLKASPISNNSYTFRICLTGVLCAMAIAGRILLWVAPNIQPVTVLIILISVYIGLYEGIASAIIVPVVTNLLMGSLGLWTVYQAIAWAFIGLLSWLFFRKNKNSMSLFVWSIASAYIYGTIVDACSWQVFSSGTGLAGFLSYRLTSILFDTYHAIGNGVFIWVFLPVLRKFLEKRSSTKE